MFNVYAIFDNDRSFQIYWNRHTYHFNIDLKKSICNIFYSLHNIGKSPRFNKIKITERIIQY